MPNCVCAGVVAYNPKPDELSTLVETLLHSAGWVVVVDNNSSDRRYLEALEGQSGVIVIRNSENCGVSGGINQIIAEARARDAKFVIAFDQDTKITAGLIPVLASHLESLLESGEAVAAIGPCVVDDYTNQGMPFVRFNLPFNTRYNRETLPQREPLVECDFLISSGCLMSLQALNDIGDMNDELFIDNVDLEWCFRARNKQYAIYGDFTVAVRQKIGVALTQIPLTNAVIRYHDYSRHYFMTRNRVWLYRQHHANTAWVVHDVLRFTCKFLYLLVFKRNRLALLKSSLRGVIDSFALKSYNDVKL
jgi:rhamnosyltransferase